VGIGGYIDRNMHYTDKHRVTTATPLLTGYDVSFA